MNGSNNGAAVSVPSTRSTGTEAAVLILSEVEKLAAERRAVAEEVLTQAREFELHLATERQSIAQLVAAAEAAQAAELQATQAAQAAQSKLLELEAAAADARVHLRAAQQTLMQQHEARQRADNDVSAIQARIEQLSGQHGLSADAIKRIVERRLADRVRKSTGDAAT
jgi:hypothetical protein